MKTTRFLSAAIFALAITFTLSCSSNGGSGDGGGTSSPSGNGDLSSSSVGGGSSSSDASTGSSSSAKDSSSSSVGSTSSPSGGGGNENSQIYIGHWDEDEGGYHIDGTYKGSGDIKILVYKYGAGYDTLVINAGSVTNGIVNLELPTTTLPDEYLGEYSCGLIGSDHLGSNYFILTNSSGERIGRLNTPYSFYVDYVDKQLWEMIQYEYFSKAGKIACNVGEGDFNTIYDIDAKIGWNKIYFRSYSSNGVLIQEHSTNNILTKEVKWTLEEDQ